MKTCGDSSQVKKLAYSLKFAFFFTSVITYIRTLVQGYGTVPGASSRTGTLVKETYLSFFFPKCDTLQHSHTGHNFLACCQPPCPTLLHDISKHTHTNIIDIHHTPNKNLISFHKTLQSSLTSKVVYHFFPTQKTHSQKHNTNFPSLSRKAHSTR